ncbi:MULTISPECIES: hypothetical protein [unclassified Archaeoglobus]|jgi:hypothetical protein|uniref:hypothetical protein n=1 Tax=unclassified Archaeoglobus TaxID=2643606 RepID=UPI0025B9988D|nr:MULTISPECIES: hypothetical protein [unclassified Archaeoglobus]
MSKFYLIAGTLFVFNLVLGLLNALDLGYSGAYDPKWASTVKEQMGSINKYGQNVITDVIYAIGDYIRTLPIFIQALSYATVLLPVMLSNFYLPDFLVWTITPVVWLSYVAAGIEFISGRVIER